MKKELNADQLDGYSLLPRFEDTWCLRCKHFFGVGSGCCHAYPNGIPDKFAIRNACDWGNVHNVIEPDQEGSYLFQVNQ